MTNTRERTDWHTSTSIFSLSTRVDESLDEPGELSYSYPNKHKDSNETGKTRNG